MKNIFKLMGIALMAGSMIFVTACGDDKKENGEPGGSTSTPLAITFGGEKMTIGHTSANWNTENQYGLVDAAKAMENDSYVMPFFYLGYGAATDGNIYPMDVFQNNPYPTEAYYEQALQTQNGYMGDYQVYDLEGYQSCVFDATALTLSCNITYKMYKYMDLYEQYQESGVEQVTQELFNEWISKSTKKDLVVKMDKLQFAEDQQ